MSKNVECSNRVTPSVDLMIAEKTNSLLSDLTRDFEDLRKCIRNYIPDYAIKHELIYSLEDICKIYSLCDNIVKNRNTLDYDISYQSDKDPFKTFYISPLRWCKVMKYLTNEDIMYIDNYLERFNHLNHFLSATRTLNVDVHNAIHTVFKNSNGNVLNKVYGILSKANDASHSYVSKKHENVLSVEHDDYIQRWDAYSDYFSIRGYDNNNSTEFEILYNEWSGDEENKKQTFYEWLKDIDKLDNAPTPKFSELFDSYAAWHCIENDEEKYNKLFDDWCANFRPNGIPFEAYLVENGYLLVDKISNEKNKNKSKIRN